MLSKLTETAEKGFLGGLKGAAGSWDKVVRAYEYNRECFERGGLGKGLLARGGAARGGPLPPSLLRAAFFCSPDCC